MPIIGDVFGLTSIYERQVENIDNNNFESWPESDTYGYFGGGTNPPSYLDTIDRIDFSNETTSAPGNNLPQARYGLAACSSSSYGYFGGGFILPSTPSFFKDTVDRIDFSNETTSAPGDNLSEVRSSLAACSSNNYGYFGGGQSPAESPSFRTIIDRLDFSNETILNIGDLSQGRIQLAAVSSSSYGYFGGGRDPGLSPGWLDTVDRIDFSNETTSAPGDNLPQARSFVAACSSNSYGYFGGGQNPAESPSVVNTIDRIDFSNGTTSAPSNNLPQARGSLAACSSNNYGYFGGGFDPPTVTTIDRIDFSNETTSAPGKDLPQERYGLAALSGGASQRIKGSRTYGYFAGGEGPPQVSTVDRIDFSNETVSAPGENLPQGRENLAACSSNSYGYFAGGEGPPPSGGDKDTIDRIDFSNETMSLLGNNLPEGREDLAACSSSSYGYFGGGVEFITTKDTIDRIDFSNETTSAPGNNLTQEREVLAALSSSSYGYFGGGDKNFNYKNIVDRIDFSNETTSAPGNDLSESRLGLAAVSSSSYGYFGGGESSPDARVDRIDFSNETTSAPGNNLTQAREHLAACSSTNYGYFGGGEPSPDGRIDRIDFSNETTSDVGDLSQGRESLAAVSN